MQSFCKYGLIIAGEAMDHIEGLFNEMLDDVKYIKLATYFRSLKKIK